MAKIRTISSVHTQEVAKIFASEIAKKKIFEDQALIILFKGNLGAGKTTFIQGFMRGLGIKSKITSPTFVIMKSYKLRSSGYKNIHHIDAYRIKNPKEILDLNFKKIISDPQNIILIEWPEKISKIIPKNKILIYLDYGKKETERILQIK